MRRITRVTKKRKKVEDEAIQTLRRVRKQLDPEMLDNMKNIIEAAEQGIDNQDKIDKMAREAMAQSAPQAAPEADDVDEFGHVPVDRQKNMAIIMKFLEENRNNTELMRKMKDTLISAMED